MGRYYPDSKGTVEESCDLTIFQLKKYGMLEGGHTATVITWVKRNTGRESSIRLEVNMTNEPHVRCTYSVSDGEGNSAPYDSKISLVTTQCHFGGVRYWFACPTCSSRVGGLYLAPRERHFKCRHCNNLTYRSRNRCKIEAWGHTSRQIEKLQGEIKRWTWRDMPTRKVKRLHKLNRKMDVLTAHAAAMLDKMRR